MKTKFQLQIMYRVKELREQHNVSQALLSDILELNSSASIGMIETPYNRRKYTLKQINRVADYFDYPVEKFFLSSKDLEMDKNKLLKIFINKIVEYNG